MTEPKMATVVKNLLRSRAESYFDSNISSTGVLPNICEALRKHGLFNCFKLWFETSVFPVYSWWKAIVRRKVCENQNEVWSDFCLKHPDLKQVYDCLNNLPLYHFWSLADHYPDLVSRLHVQVKIMGNFGLNPNQYGGGGHYGPLYSFSSISPERLELRPSNFLAFTFYLLAVRKI